MEKICTCIKNIGVLHSFEKMKPQLCFFFKKPSLVTTSKTKCEKKDKIHNKTREGFLRKNIVAVSFFQNCAIHQYS